MKIEEFEFFHNVTMHSELEMNGMKDITNEFGIILKSISGMLMHLLFAHNLR
jgi:hypothetical protein